MKIIQSINSYAIKVDGRDFDELSQFAWRVTGKYAARSQTVTGKKALIYMHRVITCCPSGMQVDHINHNTLDNRRRNLRIVTASQNHWNSKPNVNNKSGHTGIYWNKQNKRWHTTLVLNGRTVWLGHYKLLEDAVTARANGERLYYGKFRFNAKRRLEDAKKRTTADHPWRDRIVLKG